MFCPNKCHHDTGRHCVHNIVRGIFNIKLGIDEFDDVNDHRS
jgi:hypothetical protein